MRYLSLFLLILAVCGCGRKLDESEAVMKSLNKAGNNRSELIEVLDHYRNDPEKLAAARYLIANMRGHYGYDGAQLDSLELFLKAYDGQDGVLELDSATVDRWNSKSFYQLPRKEDLQNMSSEYLIANIEHAYKRWKEKPWNKELSFEDFCELLLPFCIGDDRLTCWREPYSQRFEAWLDANYSGDDAIEAAKILCDTILKEGWTFNDQLQTPHRDATGLLDAKVGYNRDLCDRLLYALRACGIPATIDMALNSQDKQTTYQWIAVRDNLSGNFVPFDVENLSLENEHLPEIPWSLGKVYRLSYAPQEDRMDRMRDIRSLATRLNNTFLKDVTADYFGDNEVTVRVRLEPDQTVYLGVWNQVEWRIDDSGDRTEDKMATFTNIEPEVIFVPVKLDGYKFVPCGHGFYYLPDSTVHILKPDTLHYEKVKLYKTMNLSGNLTGDNEFVKKGDDYELSYLAGSRSWVSLGTKYADKDFIEFEVPSNSLLMLKNLSEGTGGQMFIFQGGKQLFSKDKLK